MAFLGLAMKTGAIKKRIRQCEDMFLWHLFGILAIMAKADSKVEA